MSPHLAAGVAHPAAGFSLIEMLIATTLLALLSTLLLGGVQLGTRVMDAGSRRSERNAQLAVAYEFLRQHLAQAQRVTRAVAPGDKAPIEFDGQPDGVAFVGLASPYQALGGHHVLAIQMDRQAVLATWRRFEPARDGGPERAAQSKVLLDDIAAAEFSYFGIQAKETAPRWHADWRGQDDLPALVMLRLTLRDGRPAPHLVVAPRLSDAAQGSRP